MEVPSITETCSAVFKPIKVQIEKEISFQLNKNQEHYISNPAEVLELCKANAEIQSLLNNAEYVCEVKEGVFEVFLLENISTGYVWRTTTQTKTLFAEVRLIKPVVEDLAIRRVKDANAIYDLIEKFSRDEPQFFENFFASLVSFTYKYLIKPAPEKEQKIEITAPVPESEKITPYYPPELVKELNAAIKDRFKKQSMYFSDDESEEPILPNPEPVD
jgi:hypothetical protein